jgi:uncharacterized protein (DUF58 family)
MLPSEVMQQIRRIQIKTNRAINDLLAGQYESVFKGQGMEFKEVTGHPYVKVLAEERELTVMLMVDMSGSGRFGSVARFKNELAAELCAVLAFSATRNNDKVGLLIFTDQVELFVPPQKGRQHVLRVIREVLAFNPKHAGTNIPEALHYLSSVVRRRAVVFLVSDFMDEGYEDALRIASKRHDLIGVAVTDPREETLPDAGLIAMRDPETGRELIRDSSDSQVRDAYAKAARIRTARRTEIFRRNAIDSMNIRTDSPYLDVVYRFFRMRERRMAHV